MTDPSILINKYDTSGLYYLDRLVQQWAVKYNVAVLIDIHAAKGSQNGNDNSAPSVPGQVYWSQYQENVNSTFSCRPLQKRPFFSRCRTSQ